MTIRNATLEDLQAIHNIETSSFQDGSYPLFVLRQLFDISEKYFLVAEIEDQICGYIIGTISAKDEQGWILSVGVHPDARGNKVGRNLIKKIISLLEYNMVKEICLTVHPDNAAAIKIYKALQFEIMTTHDNYYLDHQPRYLMKKKAVSTQLNT